MNIEITIYAICIVITTFAVSGINFDHFIKTNKAVEAKLLAIILSISLGYLLGDFVILFIN